MKGTSMNPKTLLSEQNIKPPKNSPTKDVIVFDQVHKSFNGSVAIGDLDFRVKTGERLAILGRTGAGKSTLLNLLVGNFEPTSGTVKVGGFDPFRDHDDLQGIIGMAYQSPRLVPWRTALENVAIGQEILGIPKTERLDNAAMWLERVNLGDSLHKYPAELSGGMRQRVSLARSFAIDPEVMLLDEAFSALDEVTAQQLRSDFLEVANEVNATALIVTHNIEEAFTVANKVMVLGRPAKILAEYDTAETPGPKTPEFMILREEIHNLLQTSI